MRSIGTVGMGRRRALRLVRGEAEARHMDELMGAWQVIHDTGAHNLLLDWQKGVMQNLVFGQVILGDPRVVPGLPRTFTPYGALKGIEAR